MTRPPREHWSVGKELQKGIDFQQDKLVSTADVLQRTADIPEDGVRAVYSFQRDCSRMKPATMKQYGMAAANGAAWGAVGGAACGLGLNLFGQLFEVFTLGMLGQSHSLGLVVPALMGAAVGSFIGPANVHAEHADYPHYGESLGGTLKGEYGPDGQKHLRFYYGGVNQKPEKVELEKFVEAPVVGGGEPGSMDADPQWWQAGYPNVNY
jgi:hypothetical protein